VKRLGFAMVDVAEWGSACLCLVCGESSRPSLFGLPASHNCNEPFHVCAPLDAEGET